MQSFDDDDELLPDFVDPDDVTSFEFKELPREEDRQRLGADRVRLEREPEPKSDIKPGAPTVRIWAQRTHLTALQGSRFGFADTGFPASAAADVAAPASSQRPVASPTHAPPSSATISPAALLNAVQQSRPQVQPPTHPLLQQQQQQQAKVNQVPQHPTTGVPASQQLSVASLFDMAKTPNPQPQPSMAAFMNSANPSFGMPQQQPLLQMPPYGQPKPAAVNPMAALQQHQQSLMQQQQQSQQQISRPYNQIDPSMLFQSAMPQAQLPAAQPYYGHPQQPQQLPQQIPQQMQQPRVISHPPRGFPTSQPIPAQQPHPSSMYPPSYFNPGLCKVRFQISHILCVTFCAAYSYSMPQQPPAAQMTAAQQLSAQQLRLMQAQAQQQPR